MSGYVKPSNFVRDTQTRKFLNTPFINMPINATATVTQFTKGQATHDPEKPSHVHCIEFFASNKDMVAAWIYRTEAERDADYDTVAALDFFG
ncbi:hypothetical protein BN7874_029 [Phage NCTB]|jgi:hypothetical protein|nr:hypothetical protein BN7874_029 [Phage NCTB]